MPLTASPIGALQAQVGLGLGQAKGYAMGLGRPWDVPEDFWTLLWRSREHRQLVINVAVAPAGKGPAGRRSSPEFQRQVMDQMQRYHRYPMRGPVALDLHFHAAHRNPPSVYRAVKHTLDLLGPVLPGIERPRRRSVLYRDDRQVKFLYADLDQEWSRKDSDGTSTGRLFMVARRASDVAADLCVAARLHQGCWDDEDDEESPFWSPDIPEEPEPGWPLDPGFARTPTEQYLADAFHFHHVMDVQEAILARTDATMIWALGSYLDDLSGGDRPAELASILEKSRAESRDLLLSNPFTLPLPGLPRATGQSGDFVRMIRTTLEGFRVRFPLFQSLLVPVTLTFLVIPPEQGKDLDNIALTALPIAHEVLRPHISPHLLSPIHGDAERDSQRADALGRLKSVNARSVRAYQVIELPRSPQDPPGGDIASRSRTAHPPELVAPRHHLPMHGHQSGRPARTARRQHVEKRLRQTLRDGYLRPQLRRGHHWQHHPLTATQTRSSAVDDLLRRNHGSHCGGRSSCW